VSHDRNRSSWKRQQAKNIKIGHGGTLDPLATGVLVVGVGKGTKQMNNLLGSTKTYETVVLFGKSTETYDVAGKVVAAAPYQHISKTLVQERLASFRGKISQVPPIYSSLRIDGMKAYDYARTGKELPRKLAAREVEVHECELVEWFEGGQHDYRWPATEAQGDEKQRAKDLMVDAQHGLQEAENPHKRKLPDVLHNGREDDSEGNAKKQKTVVGGETVSPDASKSSSTLMHKRLPAAEKARLHTHEIGPLSLEICPAPAARIRLTTSSGFYVRSFAHDLGVVCGSLALMATLFRSRQAMFDSASSLAYQDLEGGEEMWAPKLEKMLERWDEQHPDGSMVDDRGRAASSNKKPWRVGRGQGQRRDRGKKDRGRHNSSRERRNTSSGET
jgi:tRNA pseudouridine55 synthase